jgi:anti-sigma factor RsiW
METHGPTNPSDRQLWETFSAGLPVHSVSACPDPLTLTLAAWLDGRLDEAAATAVEEHLAVCEPCREAIAAVRSAGDDDEAMMLVPPGVVEAAMGLVKPAPLVVTTERARRWSMPDVGRWAVAAAAGIVVCLIGYQAGTVSVQPAAEPGVDVISEMTFGVFDNGNGMLDWDTIAGEEVAG